MPLPPNAHHLAPFQSPSLPPKAPGSTRGKARLLRWGTAGLLLIFVVVTALLIVSCTGELSIHQGGTSPTAAAVLPTATAVPPTATSLPCPSGPDVKITTPTADSQVPLLTTVQGTICQLPPTMDLWVLIVPDGVSAYYPQTGPVIVTTGIWSTSAHVGLDTDVGKGFTLIAALADPGGSAAIQTYFNQSGPDFKGLDPLPGGIQLLAQVHVVRK
jgi:hypothetical protein